MNARQRYVAELLRIRHNAFATSLPPIRTLLYFREIIHEMLDRPPGFREVEQVRETLRAQH